MAEKKGSRTGGKVAAAGLKSKPPGMHGDGGGLWLQVKPNEGGRSWIFRDTLNGRSHEMGLGSLDAIGLAQARMLAEENRKLLAAIPPIDPIENRRALLKAAKAEARRAEDK